jgi:hypothetical protein
MAMGDDAAQALLWGRWATDPEIRDACEKLWFRLFRCPTCEGSGERWNQWKDGDGYTSRCLRCSHSGDLRFEELWSSSDEDPKYRERDVGRAVEWEEPR